MKNARSHKSWVLSRADQNLSTGPVGLLSLNISLWTSVYKSFELQG